MGPPQGVTAQLYRVGDAREEAKEGGNKVKRGNVSTVRRFLPEIMNGRA
jgi:hypothetical protein